MNKDDPRHGTINGYSNRHCRCAECRKAWTAYLKKRRAERALLIQPDDPRHGTLSFYYNHACRCDSCKEVHARRARELRIERKRRERNEQLVNNFQYSHPVPVQ